MALRRFAALCACLAAVLLGGCNEHQAVLDTPVGPTATITTPRPPEVAGVSVSPGGVEGGEEATGIVSLTGPAPSSAPVIVSLSSSNEAVIVPATVTLEPGITSTSFRIETQRFPNDRTVVISAMTAQETRSTELQVWTRDAQMFFKFYSDQSDSIGRGDFGRFVPGSAKFSAFCDENWVNIRIETAGPEFWHATFRARGRDPLRPGVYHATGVASNFSEPYLQISGRGRACSRSEARFSIEQIDLQNNKVNVFQASFEQQCVGGNQPPGSIRGQLRLQFMPPSSSVVTCMR